MNSIQINTKQIQIPKKKRIKRGEYKKRIEVKKTEFHSYYYLFKLLARQIEYCREQNKK